MCLVIDAQPLWQQISTNSAFKQEVLRSEDQAELLYPQGL